MKTAPEEIIAGEILDDVETELTPVADADLSALRAQESNIKNQRSVLNYLVLPLIFLVVTLLGGLRLQSGDNAFIFLKPPLICLVFGAILLVLYFRAGLVTLDDWFSEEYTTLKNVANG